MNDIIKVLKEIEKCEIVNSCGGLYFVYKGIQHNITSACDRADFIGFLYEDGATTSCSRLHSFCGCNQTVYWPIMGGCEVVTPTHVLFKNSKDSD